MTASVTDADFDAVVLGSAEPVLVDFWAEWCQPCLALDPVLDAAGTALGQRLKIVKLDVAGNPAVTARYNVRNMPTLIVFRDGAPVDIKVGAGQSRVQMNKWLEGHAA